MELVRFERYNPGGLSHRFQGDSQYSMNRLLPISILFLTLQSTLGNLDQRLPFRSLTVDDGLSQGYVSSICQDNNGFIWIGTANGLNRFDGYKTTVYTHQASIETSLIDNRINDLHVDGKGSIWIGTDTGLDRYEPATDSFSHFLPDPEDAMSLGPGRVRLVRSDKSGSLWVVTDLVNRLNPETGEVTRYSLDGTLDGEGTPYALTFLEDSRGTIWVGTGAYNIEQGVAANQYGLFRYHSESDSFVPIFSRSFNAGPESEGVSNISEGNDGTLWISFWGEGLRPFDSAAGIFIDSERPLPAPLRDLFITKVIAGRKGELWVIGSFNGNWAGGRMETNSVPL